MWPRRKRRKELKNLEKKLEELKNLEKKLEELKNLEKGKFQEKNKPLKLRVNTKTVTAILLFKFLIAGPIMRTLMSLSIKKNTNSLLKKMKNFGLKKEKEFLG